VKALAMATYQLSPAFLAKCRKQALFRFSFVLPLLAGFGLLLGLQSDDGGTAFLLATPLVVVVLAFSVARTLSRQRQSLASCRLWLEDDLLRRTQDGFPEVCIHKDEATELVEIPGIGLGVFTPEKARSITVPEGLEGYDDLKKHLSGWMPIKQMPSVTDKQMLTRSVVLMVLVVAGIAVTMLYNDPKVVLPVGSLLVFLLLWGFVQIRRSPHVEARIKRTSWIVFFPMVWIFGRVIQVLSR
jgi:hypothetical protein